MPVVATVNKRRFVFKPFTSSQMRSIAQELADSIIERIRRGENVRDAAAKSLTEAYSRRKSKRGDIPVRDWFWTGRTLSALKVTSANENRFVIGFSNALANKIAGAQNKRERTFGVSPNDKRVLNAAIMKALQQRDMIQFEEI